jgi:hypothetical protein
MKTKTRRRRSLKERKRKSTRLQTPGHLFLLKRTFAFVRTAQNRIKSTGYG